MYYPPRIGINFGKQIAIIPSFGVTWGGSYKFGIAFIWLNMQFCIRFFRKKVNNEYYYEGY